jgi:thiol-disulfide isomerase/thioredoxin
MMSRRLILPATAFFMALPLPMLAVPQNSPEISQILAQGDAFITHRQFDKAMDAYHQADKLAQHKCADCYFRMITLERRLGNLPAAFDDAKRSVKAAGDNKTQSARGHLICGTLLAAMATNRNDEKLREAEAEFRDALALDPAQVIVHFDLGMILLRQERSAEGIAELHSFLASPGADSQTVREARRLIAEPRRAIEPFAPDFSFTVLAGGTVSNTTLHGKVVLLDFWGVWCAPCRAFIPTLEELHKKFADSPFEIVGISSDQDEHVWKDFVTAKQLDWPQYIDSSGEVQTIFNIHKFPTYIVLDREGIIEFQISEVTDRTHTELEDAIRKALQRPYTPPSGTSATQN